MNITDLIDDNEAYQQALERIQGSKVDHISKAMVERLNTFPRKGNKLIFTGVPKFYYPMFTDIGENARKTLVLNQEYTVRKCEVYSSWCAVWLDGTDGDTLSEGFHLQFFKEV